MLNGIQIKPLKRRFDERGFFLELMRKDWKELLKEDNIVQANLSRARELILIRGHAQQL